MPTICSRFLTSYQASIAFKKAFFCFLRPLNLLALSLAFIGNSSAQPAIAQANIEGNMETTLQSNSSLSGKVSVVPYVRLAELTIMSTQIRNFKTASITNINNTLDQEEGVLEFHALIKKGIPDQVFVFEIYKDKKAYKTHIRSQHYKQFGNEVGAMIKAKTLHDTIPVILGRKPQLSSNPHVRIAELDIHPAWIDAYMAAVTEEIEDSIRLEPGVLAIYSVALKHNPTQLRFLEFYANEQAYLLHRESPHFQKYLAITKPMIKSLKLFEAEVIKLGVKQPDLEITQPHIERRRLSPNDVQQVAPALEHYTQEKLYGEVWKHPDLSLRDRSIVTISAMIARGQTGALPYYFAQALDNGVKPGEISEIIVHLAYYAGWGNAFGAIGPAKEVFAQRGIGPDQLPAAKVELLPFNEEAEKRRAASVEANYGAIAPGVVQYTTDALFLDLWRRPDLTPEIEVW